MRRILGYKFRRTTLWLWCFMSLLAGLSWAHTGLPLSGWWCFACVPLLCATMQKRQWSAALFILVFGVCCGWWRGAGYLQQLHAYDRWQRHTVTVTVHAMDDAAYDTHQQLAFNANHVTLETGEQLPGKIQVSGFGTPAIFQGDEVEASGKFYPSYGTYQSELSFADLTVLAHHPTIVSAIRRKFTAGMQTALPEPLAPFAMGLLVGQRATLPSDIKQDLLMVGLTHIIAVSGYNLTIILHASKKVLGMRSKRITAGLSLGLVAVFLLIAGASASIVRAAIVSALSVMANYYGRAFKPLNLIALAAALTALVNPIYIWSDLSWYLSFLAFFGVMVISPLLQARLPGNWHQTLAGAVALESVCAELMSLPFILYIFGQMSFIGLPANVLVVTCVPLAMLLSLFAGMAGMLVAPLAGWVAWPAKLLLTYMLDTAHVLAGLPHIFVENRTLPLVAMLIMYSLVVGLILVLRHKTKQLQCDMITDRNQVVTEGQTT